MGSPALQADSLPTELSGKPQEAKTPLILAWNTTSFLIQTGKKLQISESYQETADRKMGELPE